MRILHLNNYHYPRGGSDRYFLEVARALANRGHNVRTFATASERDIDEDLMADNSLSPTLPSHRPPVFEIPRFFYNFSARDTLKKIIAEFRPEIVHLHIYYGQLTSSILGPIRQAGIPIVQTLHEYKTVCPAQTMLRDQTLCTACRHRHYWNAARYKCNRSDFLRSCFSASELVFSEWFGARRYVDRFLAVSDFQKAQLCAMGLPSEKITRLYNFTQLPETVSTSKGEYFLYVGRIVHGKGIETLLNAYKHYLAKCIYVPLPLHIVGTGEAYHELQDSAREMGLGDQVKWLGFQTGASLDRAYRNCRALINPSEYHETFGLNNLEAMAHGRPVICSDRGAFPEIVRNLFDGYIVGAGDVSGFADRMLALSPGQALELGGSGYQRVQDLFSEEAHLSELERIYDSLV